jgi:lipoprotein-anchoring transpeptidase ErfK/SrfK
MKTRFLLVASAALLVAVLAALALTAGGSGSHHEGITAAADPAAGSPAAAADPGVTVAHLTHDRVAVHADASLTSSTTATMRAKTPLGSPTTVLVVDRRDGWIDVALASRPNGSSGWVSAGDVQESTDDVAITVSLADHVMRVTRGGAVAVETPVAVGAPGTPTPVGRFYVTDLVDTGQPRGAYGPYALGLSAHSDVLDQFAGGDGQIGIHGTNEPASIGQSVSHGCVRVPDEVISALAGSVPLGTPVTIS